MNKQTNIVKRARNAQEKKVRERKASTRHRGTQVDEITIDARIEEKGEATQPAEKPSVPRNVPYTRGMDCAKCKRHLKKAQFQVIQNKTEESPLVRDSVCKACRAEEKAADLKAARIERAAHRRKRELYKGEISAKQGKGRAEAYKQNRSPKRKHIEDKAREELAKEKERRKAGGLKQREANNERALNEHVVRELARRELCRRKLVHFTRRFEGQKVDPETGDLMEVQRAKGKGYDAGWVHQDICARLERFLVDVQAGRQPRLMLCMPPRHGKSTIASRMFPAWALGQDPTLEIIAASYGSSLPEQFSRNVRGLLRDPEYGAIFNKTRLDPERENVQGWATTQGGQYIPAGVGSGISGKGADLLIIDDPFKGAEDAENANQREKVLDWYFSEAFTRLSPNAGVVMIQTRWHDADLAGSLLTSQQEQENESREILDSEMEEIVLLDGSEKIQAQIRAYAAHKERLRDVEQWEVVSYPAIAESDEYRLPDGRIVYSPQNKARLLRHKGEALHSTRYPLERLRRIRRNFFARGRQRFWHALYQQKPVPDEGIHFTRDMIKIITPPSYISRAHWRKFSAWDIAAGQKQQHDYTVGVHGQMDFTGTMHILEITRGRFDGAHGVACEVLDDYERNKPDVIGVERGPLEQFLMPSIRRELEARNKRQGTHRLTPVFADGELALTPISDAMVRAGPLQSLMQQQKVVFSAELPYIEEMIQELVRFPGAVHDDIVTALSWLIRLSLKFSVPRQPSNYRKKRSWRDKLRMFTKKYDHMAA